MGYGSTKRGHVREAVQIAGTAEHFRGIQGKDDDDGEDGDNGDHDQEFN
jgi:hypothetical protein